MISLFGNLSLIAAMIFAFMQSVLPIIGYYQHNPYLNAFARPAALGQFFFILFAFALLVFAFLNSDFSLTYVAANSHPTLPFLYRLTAIWGAHEGSILLWIVILNIWTLAFSSFVPRDDSQREVLTIAILGMISFAFLIFLFFTSNPFQIAAQMMQGKDLNPLLQDPGFVIHPPMLYTGYVGFSVAFAMTLAALLGNQLDATWARITRHFAIAAFCFLTLGIALGSWWAYRVLGWGGFWFWDPVENASLLPWICGTALIHILLLVERQDTAKGWATLLAIICFALSLLGTFLVRSGVLISVHSFASDPLRGVFLLILLAIISTAALIIYAIHLPKSIPEKKVTLSFLSRDMALFLNSTLLFVAMATILLGTLYPLIIDALHLGTISVGAPYFNLVMTPLVIIIMFFMGLAGFCRWQQQSVAELWQRIWKPLTISFISAFLLIWYFADKFEPIAMLSLGLSFWILGSFSRKTPGMSVAHSGFAILIIGIMLSTLLSQERQVNIKPGNAANIGPYHFFFMNVSGTSGANYRGVRAAFEVTKKIHHVTNLYPEKRIYVVRDTVMTKVDIHPGIFRDLYIALGEPLDENAWSVRMYYKPFIRWIWLGALLMMLGGLITMVQSHKKRGTTL